jgi:hypothetical protein
LRLPPCFLVGRSRDDLRGTRGKIFEETFDGFEAIVVSRIAFGAFCISGGAISVRSWNAARYAGDKNLWRNPGSVEADNRRGFDLISDALPFGHLWYGEPNAISNAIAYAMHQSQSHHAVIRVYDAVGNVIETHEQAGDFREW